MNERGFASHAGTPAADGTTAGATSNQDRELLAHRARQLARPVTDVDVAESHTTALLFRRGSERFAIPLDVVMEVQRGSELTALPGAAAPVIGVMPWRGRILTVIDIAADASRPTSDAEWRAIVIGRGRARIAMQADVVDETASMTADECRPLDEAAARSASGRAPIAGITADAVLVLDGEELLRRYPG